MIRRPPRSTLFPYTTLFRSDPAHTAVAARDAHHLRARGDHIDELASDPRRLGAADPLLPDRSEEHTSELQSHLNLVCRLLLEKKKNKTQYELCEYYTCAICN